MPSSCLDIMQRNGARVTRLMNQTLGKDDRQSMWLHPNTATEPATEDCPDPVFPNQPFEEHKKRDGKRWGR